MSPTSWDVCASSRISTFGQVVQYGWWVIRLSFQRPIQQYIRCYIILSLRHESNWVVTIPSVNDITTSVRCSEGKQDCGPALNIYVYISLDVNISHLVAHRRYSTSHSVGRDGRIADKLHNSVNWIHNASSAEQYRLPLYRKSWYMSIYHIYICSYERVWCVCYNRSMRNIRNIRNISLIRW